MDLRQSHPESEPQRQRCTLTDLKHQAAEYYRSNEVPQRLEEVLNTMFYLRPPDFYGHLANYFSKLSKPPVICRLVGKKVLDGTGHPTLEVEVSCQVKNCDKTICSSMISSHAEILENASPEVVDADEKERHESVDIAVTWIDDSLNELLEGLQPTDQYKVDELLGEYFTKKAEEEEEERREAEKEKEKEKETQEIMFPPPPPVTAPSGKKKQAKLGKKISVVENPIPPAEPAVSVIKGSMAIGCVSLAVVKAAATTSDMPLYLQIALMKHNQDLPEELIMPLPMITLLSYGKSSPGKLNLMKEVMLIPPAWLTVKKSVEMSLDIHKQIMKLLEPQPSPSAESKKSARDAGKKAPPPVFKKMSHLGCIVTGSETLEQPLTLIQMACTNIGLELGIDLYLGMNCAAHELMDYNKGKYEVLSGTLKNPDEMVDMYVNLIHKFPYIIALIDPLRKEDTQQWENLCSNLGSKCYLIAEHACRNMSKHLDGQKKNAPKCSGLVVKYINETKISDLLEMTKLLDGVKHVSVFGSSDGESSDDSLVDLAVGLETRFIKLGGLSRGERVTKYNRLLAIEEELFQNGILCSRGDFEFIDFTEDEQEEEEEFYSSDLPVETVQLAL
ncbi:PREDICTED: LOW QUALITY PROTEIN: enolase-like protein ENO4 [Gekko japonicus]|uniref:Enolase 4 n=1 Tax=Gekko japonicus TaxID=146911 RepID=A0ABM1K701_GEKJA|nr:PREDICTED: LOW QUALITY PROTEIN: enolase-like protein ENO4 [Gekko japonicus]